MDAVSSTVSLDQNLWEGWHCRNASANAYPIRGASLENYNHKYFD